MPSSSRPSTLRPSRPSPGGSSGLRSPPSAQLIPMYGWKFWSECMRELTFCLLRLCPYRLCCGGAIYCWFQDWPEGAWYSGAPHVHGFTDRQCVQGLPAPAGPPRLQRIADVYKAFQHLLVCRGLWGSALCPRPPAPAGPLRLQKNCVVAKGLAVILLFSQDLCVILIVFKDLSGSLLCSQGSHQDPHLLKGSPAQCFHSLGSLHLDVLS